MYTYIHPNAHIHINKINLQLNIHSETPVYVSFMTRACTYLFIVIVFVESKLSIIHHWMGEMKEKN